MEHKPIVEEFSCWIASGSSGMEKDGTGNWHLESHLASADLRFYLEDLVEIMVQTKADNSLKYYLHFQLNDLDNAKSLFGEMMEAFRTVEERKKVRIVLTCTSGATSGYLTELLNQAADMMNLEYEFEAAAAWRVFEAAVDADVVLVAPQAGYKFKSIKKGLPKKLVLMAPTILFTANDTYGTLRFLDVELAKFREIKRRRNENRTKYGIAPADEANPVILCIGSIKGSENIRTYYQLWNGNRKLTEGSMNRPFKYGVMQEEVMDAILSQVPDVDLIVIGIPGVVDEKGRQRFLFQMDSETRNYKRQLEEKYGIPVHLMNNANAAVLGFQKRNPGYHNIVLHSQPYGKQFGGQGIISNDRLVQGKNGLCGEPSLFLEQMQFSNNLDRLAKRESGMLEIVVKSLLPTIGLFAPEVIAIRSSMTSDMEQIAQRLEEYISPDYIPELVYIDNMEELLLEGLLIQGRKLLD